MRILGISAFYHDSAAALIVDGKVVSAQEEERFTGIKHDQRFPINSIKWILKQNKLKINPEFESFITNLKTQIKDGSK